jgi:hypothetical protein
MQVKRRISLLRPQHVPVGIVVVDREFAVHPSEGVFTALQPNIPDSRKQRRRARLLGKSTHAHR